MTVEASGTFDGDDHMVNTSLTSGIYSLAIAGPETRPEHPSEGKSSVEKMGGSLGGLECRRFVVLVDRVRSFGCKATGGELRPRNLRICKSDRTGPGGPSTAIQQRYRRQFLDRQLNLHYATRNMRDIECRILLEVSSVRHGACGLFLSPVA
ncbi:hypothetical protein TWF718_010539 [Orbilia javanica]|uniref:Uncharacterized protein n=1 Tax=Orbilia javanica TaxID=47235 RepID=A0AAN8RA57_9PEZI